MKPTDFAAGIVAFLVTWTLTSDVDLVAFSAEFGTLGHSGKLRCVCSSEVMLKVVDSSRVLLYVV
jgi:hypothetical protein